LSLQRNVKYEGIIATQSHDLDTVKAEKKALLECESCRDNATRKSSGA
jgi:hypothetical protein